MRIPTNPTNVAERHVQLSEFVDVKKYATPPSTQKVVPRVAPTVEPDVPKSSVYKRTCGTAALVCGALVIPSFAFLAFGVVGLVAPATLVVATAVCFIARGKLPPDMEAEYAARAEAARTHDSHGV